MIKDDIWLNENLSELNDIKNEKELSIENYISKKETLNEMYEYLINDIKNKNKDNIDKNYNINITLEELYFNNKESYINKILKVFKDIYNSNNKKYYILIKNTINKAYEDLLFLKNNQSTDKNILVNNFFFKISKLISTSNSDEQYINILLKILIKLNIISDKINKIIKFLDTEYKSKSSEIQNQISEKEKKTNSLEIKKVELTQLKNIIIEKTKILKRRKTPFYERIKNSDIHNNLLNSISSSINFSCELFNKSKSNSKSKSKDSNKYLYKNYNNFGFCKNKTVRHSKEKLGMNLIKNLNQKNKQVKYNTNKLSNNKIFLNGISKNLNGKNSFYFTKENHINQNKDFNENIKTERKILIKNKFKNCLTSGNKRNKIIKLIKDNTYNRFNLTESFNNSIFNNTYEIKYRINDVSNGNSNYLKDKKFKKEFNKNFSNKNNYIKENSIKTEREKENTNDLNYKIRVKKILNEDQILQKKNFNLTNIYSINKNSFFKTISSNKSKHINKWKNILGGKNKIKSEEKNEKFEKFALKLNQLSNINIKTLNNCFSKRENISKPNKIINNINSIRNNNDELKYFFYYKFLENDSQMFNPLKNNIDLNNSEYNEGLISKDISTKSITIIPIFSNQNDKNNFINSQKMFINSNGLDTINIEIKKITNVYLNNLMDNIIKIRNIYLKYNSNKNKQNRKEKENESLNINKLLNSREIMNIKDLSQEEKIKAGLCNFFSLIIEFNYIHKIELVIINFNQFNLWLTYLKHILEMNLQYKNSILNGKTDMASAKNKVTRTKKIHLSTKRRNIILTSP